MFKDCINCHADLRGKEAVKVKRDVFMCFDCFDKLNPSLGRSHSDPLLNKGDRRDDKVGRAIQQSDKKGYRP